MKKYALPVIMLVIFETVAVTLWLTKDNLFYLFNFSYIGISVSLGLFLLVSKYPYARRIVPYSISKKLPIKKPRSSIPTHRMIVSAINPPGLLPLAMAFFLLSLQSIMMPNTSNIDCSPFISTN